MECIGRIVTVIVINAIFSKEHMIQIYLIVPQFLATKRRVNKMRLIDAEQAKKISREHLSNPYEIISACAVIDSTDSVDAVPVVRCKDCKWYEPIQGVCNWCSNERVTNFRIENDFCSYGEREEE